MANIRIILLLVIFVVPGIVPDAIAASLNCDNGLISSGDRSIDVLSKCGEPVSMDSHQEEVSRRLHDNATLTVFITVDEWTYNFGPSRLMHTVILKNGVVTDVQDGNYGYTNPPEPVVMDIRDSNYEYMNQPEPTTRGCTEQVVSVGDTKADVLADCGEPWFRDAHEEEFKQWLHDGERTVFITVEEWTYNLGPDRFVRVLTFRNGKLAEIRSGGYGYLSEEEE